MENEELLFQYGELISFIVNIAKESKDKLLLERVLKRLEPHIVLYNRLSIGKEETI